jgi:hypothetical protein
MLKPGPPPGKIIPGDEIVDMDDRGIQQRCQLECESALSGARRAINSDDPHTASRRFIQNFVPCLLRVKRHEPINSSISASHIPGPGSVRI